MIRNTFICHNNILMNFLPFLLPCTFIQFRLSLPNITITISTAMCPFYVKFSIFFSFEDNHTNICKVVNFMHNLCMLKFRMDTLLWKLCHLEAKT